jgi:hypothetical protein
MLLKLIVVNVCNVGESDGTLRLLKSMCMELLNLGQFKFRGHGGMQNFYIQFLVCWTDV